MTTNRTNLPPDAVVWIDRDQAIVARTEPDRTISTIIVRRAARQELRWLADVVHEIGEHERVMIVGAEPIHVALEREFVAIGHRPDRLVPSPSPASPAAVEIARHLQALAAA